MTDLEHIELAVRRVLSKHKPYPGDNSRYYAMLCDFADELARINSGEKSEQAQGQ